MVEPYSGDMLPMVARCSTRSRRQGGAVELDEAADHAVLAEQLGDGEHQVGGGGAGRQLAGEAEADDLGDQQRDGLAEHGRLGLDAADAPAHHAEAVDHRRVGVGAHQGVGEGHAVAVLDDLGQVLQVDLVADAHVGRHHPERLEGLLAPLEELVALLVALELEGGVEVEGVGLGEGVHLDGVVDDQVDGDAAARWPRRRRPGRPWRRAWRPGRPPRARR